MNVANLFKVCVSPRGIQFQFFNDVESFVVPDIIKQFEFRLQHATNLQTYSATDKVGI